MSGREDFLNALAGKSPLVAVPIWEIEFHAWDSFSDDRITLGEKFTRLTEKEKEIMLYRNADVFLSIAQELHFSALTVPGGYWEVAPKVPAYYWLPEDTRFKQIEILFSRKPANLALVANSGGVMAMPGAAEYVQFCLDLYDDPLKIEKRAQNTLSRGLDLAHKFRDAGIEVVFTASDIADNHGVFFKRPLLEKFILPYLCQWASKVRDMGLLTILHSDGNLYSCLDEIAHSGIHALQAIDPVAGMDMLEVMNKVGNELALCGNIDCGLLLTGTPEMVYDSTRDLLEKCKSKGRLILGASNAIQPEVPAENYRAMVRAWEENGKY